MSVSSTHEAYILKGRKKEQWENRHIFIEMLAILRPEKYVKPHFFSDTGKQAAQDYDFR